MPKRAKAPSTRVQVDWATMRQEYETTNVPVRELARRHNLKSENSVRKHIESEGWVRDTETIVANLVTEGVAHREARLASQTHDIAQQSTQSREPAQQPQAEEVRGCAPEAPKCAAEPPKCAAPRTTAHQRVATVHEKGERAVSTATALAAQHVAAISEQIDWAENVAATGTAILDNVRVILAGPDDGRMGDFQNARAALAMISPDKETLAGLVKAAVAMMEGAAVLKRRALGMDVIKGGPLSPAPDTQMGRSQIEARMKQMTPEGLMQLRRATQEISRLPPPTIDQEPT